MQSNCSRSAEFVPNRFSGRLPCGDQLKRMRDMPTISEQMKERMDSRPDEHTLAWWQEQFTEVAKGYRGLTHAVNLVLVEEEDRNAKVEELRKLVEAQAKEIQEAKAAIGKLQAEILKYRETARKAYSDLKQKLG